MNKIPLPFLAQFVTQLCCKSNKNVRYFYKLLHSQRSKTIPRSGVTSWTIKVIIFSSNSITFLQ